MRRPFECPHRHPTCPSRMPAQRADGRDLGTRAAETRPAATSHRAASGTAGVQGKWENETSRQGGIGNSGLRSLWENTRLVSKRRLK
eukprot:10154764-Heterocapsa_arctica.AAC.1